MPLYGPLTPGQRIAKQALTGRIIGAARAGCEARRASTPFSPNRPGSVNEGYYNTVIGPLVSSC